MKIRLLFALFNCFRFSFTAGFFNCGSRTLFRKTVFFSVLLSAVTVSQLHAQKTWDGSTNANWSIGANWTPAGVPGAGDAVIIPDDTPSANDNPIVNANAVCASLQMSTGGNTRTLTINNGFTLTVGGAVTIQAGTGGADKTIAVGGGALSCGSITMDVTGADAQVSSLTISSGSVSVSGNITMNDASTLRNRVVFTSNGTLNVGGNITGGDLTTFAGSTVNYNGAGAQTVRDVSYAGNLTLSGSNTKTWTMTGGRTVGGILTISGGSTLTLPSNQTLGVTGATSITGTFNLGGNQAKTFTGDVTLNGGAVWNETVVAAINFGGSLTNNATTWTANTGTHTFTGAARILSGSTITSIPNTTISGTYTNNGTLTVSTALSGAGTLAQGATGTLNIGGTSGITTLTATAAGNTVNYNGGGAQAVRDISYSNLTLSGSNTKTWTMTGGRTVGGILTISGGSTLTLPSNQTLGVTGATSITGTFNLGGNQAKTFTGDVTLNGGAVWNETVVAAINFGGSLTNNATTWTANTGTHTFTGAARILSGSTITSIPNTTISGTYTNNGTLTVSTALSGAGTLAQGATGTLNIGGTSGITTLTATAAGNTVNYNGGGAQAVRDISYSNLTLSGSNTKTWTMTGGRTVGGILTISGGSTLTLPSNQTLGVTGATSITGTFNLGGNQAKTFTGDVTLNGGAVWNETVVAAINFGGSLTNNATTWTANTGTHTFTGAAKILSGSTTTSIPTATFTGTYTNSGTFTSSTLLTVTGVTLTNNGTMNASTALSGTGGVTQGTTGILNIGGASAIATLTATALGNTVNYTGAAQTVKQAASNIYYNLGLSGSGNKTFTAATTISENLSISGTAKANLGAGLTHTATTLTLGGASQPSGSHGSTGSIATYQNDTYFLSPFNGILNIACSATTSGTPTTYYSRNATSGGNWNDNNSWTTSADGTGGPLAAGVWPRIFDNVVIRSGHTITIDAIDDNEFCGISPDGLGRSNIGAGGGTGFNGSNTAMFYQTGDITISGTLSVISGINMMVEGYTHITSTGTFSLTSYLVNIGYLQADASSTLTTLDDLSLTGNSTTIINTNVTSADDLNIDHTNATLCGTGTSALLNSGGSAINYTNSATVAQICTSFTVTCSGGGCAGFPVVGTTSIILGNTGPGGVGNNTNNRLWLRANDLSLANGAAVDSWSDVSGNGLTASNGTAGERPTFATNSANGFPSITFDGTDDNLSLGAPAVLNFVPQTDSWSFVIAYQAPANGISSTPNQGTLFSKAWSGNRNYQYQIDDINATTSVLASYIGNTLNSGTVQINTNAWVISSHTNTTTTKSSFSNEAANFSGIAIAAGADAATDVLIGARRNTGPADGTEGFLFTGNIAEIMMYNSVLNAAQRIIIADYLAAKYAVTLSANDFYTMDDVGNGNFDSEVAGIGQASDGSNHKDAMGSGVVRMWNPSNLDNDEFLLWGHDNTTFYSSTTTGVGAPIQERLSRTWRVSESGGDVGTVSVSFDISLLATPLGSNLRLLIDRDGDGFADNDVTPVAGTFADNVVVFSGVNFQDGDRFTLGNTDVTNPLPIELISFSAKLNNDIVELEWSTASELNNDFFTIERAIDLERFEEVVSIKGSGTTKEKHNYKTTDSNPLYGRSYYRLKQTDFDGKFAYSDLRVIDYEGPQFSTLRVYPNPNNGQSMTLEVIGLKDQSTVPVQIYNVQGQKVFDHTFEVNTPGTMIYDLEFGNPLKSGLYIIKAGQTLQLTQKIIVD